MALAALLSLSLLLFSFSTKNTTLIQAQCLPDQHDALIQLKEDFNTTELHSWNVSTDCCIWDGVTCDEQTGMLTALNLADRHISGELNPALFNLSSLQYLDLSDNYYYNGTLPQNGFQRLGNLTHLDLSGCGFSGEVPISFSSLTNLIYLDISTGGIDPLNLPDQGLKTLLSNLTKLQVLRLDGVDILLNESDWVKAISQVGPTLHQLSMQDCGLTGNLPDEIFHLTNLTKLDLIGNSLLLGQLPEFRNQSFLQYLLMADTNITGPLPYSIANLQYLKVLILSNCNFYGELPPSITNLTRLEQLDIGSNRLTGMIPMSLFCHPSLEWLDLSYNQLLGYLPEFLNDSSILAYTFLQNNNLQGQLPISILNFTRLIELDLASNNFNGTLNVDVLEHYKNLSSLSLSYNKLSIIQGKNHNESLYASFPQLTEISLASCNLMKFPSFLSYQINIYYLDLSHNSITGEIPLSVCNMTLPTFLDLFYNNLTGTIPPCLREDAGLEELNLKSNKLSGSLPQNISQVCGFKTMNLNGNAIHGSLPKLSIYCYFLTFY